MNIHERRKFVYRSPHGKPTVSLPIYLFIFVNEPLVVVVVFVAARRTALYNQARPAPSGPLLKTGLVISKRLNQTRINKNTRALRSTGRYEEDDTRNENFFYEIIAAAISGEGIS